MEMWSQNYTKKSVRFHLVLDVKNHILSMTMFVYIWKNLQDTLKSEKKKKEHEEPYLKYVYI